VSFDLLQKLAQLFNNQARLVWDALQRLWREHFSGVHGHDDTTGPASVA